MDGIESRRILPPTPSGKAGPSETSGRQHSVYRLGVERIDRLLERLAIERGSYDKRFAVFRRLWFAKILSARNWLTGGVMDGKNRRHATAFTVRVSIRSLAPQRTSGRCARERSAPNADSSVPTKTEAPSADDLGSDILGGSPQRVVRLATSLALCPGRHRRPLAARTVPQILGQVVQPAAAAPRSPRHSRRTPPIDRANSRRQSAVARTQGSWRAEDARHCHLRAHCVAHPAQAPAATEPDVADLPAQPCRPVGLHRFLYRAHNYHESALCIYPA